MYELPPFARTFQAMEHNKYLMRRRDVVARCRYFAGRY